GWAVSADDRVPCCTSEVNMRVPVMTAITVDNQVGKLNEFPTVNTSRGSGSVLTNTASTQARMRPTAAVPERIATFERSERSLVHSLASAFGIAATLSRCERVAPARVMVLVMVMSFVRYEWMGGEAIRRMRTLRSRR